MIKMYGFFQTEILCRKPTKYKHGNFKLEII